MGPPGGKPGHECLECRLVRWQTALRCSSKMGMEGAIASRYMGDVNTA